MEEVLTKRGASSLDGTDQVTSSSVAADPVRVASLARTNHILRSINSRLARETDYASMVGVVLSGHTILMQARDAGVYRYEPENACLRLIGAVTDTKPVKSVPELPFSDPLRPCPVRQMPLWNRIKPGEIQIVRLDDDHVFDGSVPPAVEQWHRKRKHTLSLRSRLCIGRETVGWIRIAFDRPIEADANLIESFRSMSQQVTLVLQTIRLFESAAGLALADERNRIAKDMHDTLSQSITGVLMQLEAAKEFVGTNTDVVLACMDSAAAMARKSLQQSRQVVMMLQDQRPEPLTKSLPQLVADFSGTRTSAESMFSLQGTPRALPAEVDRHLLRIAQEAYGNAQRYSQARKICVSLAFTPTAVHLAVDDNGIGFAPSEMKDIGFGLSGMTKRAERIGAQLNIESTIGEGTKVHLELREPTNDSSQ